MRRNLEPIELARTVVDALVDKKAEDILLMDISTISSFADFFVICSGTSDRMLNALADAVHERAKETYRLNARLEGLPRDGWMVADLGDVVVHLFSPDRRSFYDLEELWAEGKVLLHLQ